MLCVLLFQSAFIIFILNHHCHCQTGCSPNDIRLIDGKNTHEGRLEVCYFGRWGTICNDLWNFASTTVACRQLGIGNRGYATYGYPVGMDIIAWNHVICSGEEQTLSECVYTVTGAILCVHSEDVQLVCLNEGSQPECESGSIRLVGSSTMSGRLEVCLEGVWGTVCSRYIGDIPSAASVACNQLGDNITQAFASGGVPGVGPIFLRTLHCSGDEDSILDCQAVTTIPYDVCGHWRDLYIYCYNTTEPECLDGDLRLIDGESDLEGRLEVCLDGIWGSVCDDGWTNENNYVVCRQLGIEVTSAHFAKYGVSSSPYFLNDVKCMGDEESIFDCNRAQYPSYRGLICNDFEAVGILCRTNSSNECLHGEVRLVDSTGAETTSNAGIVQLCDQGFWSTMCDEYWDGQAAVLACRNLQLPTSSGVVGFLDQSTSIVGPTAHFNCEGTENLTSACLPDDCNGRGYAAVACGPQQNPICSDGNLRLTGSDAPNEGRLEICYLGLWGTVCNDHWTLFNTYVACRQLGFQVEGSTHWSLNVLIGDGPIFIDTIVCQGNEDSLESCLSLLIRNYHNCVHIEDIHAFCPQGNITTTEATATNSNPGLTTPPTTTTNTVTVENSTEIETTVATEITTAIESTAATEITTAIESTAATETTTIKSSGGAVTVAFSVSIPMVVVVSVVIVLAIVAIRRKRKMVKRWSAPGSSVRMMSRTNIIPLEGNIYNQGFTTNSDKFSNMSKKPSTARLMNQLSSEFRIDNKYVTLLTKIGEGEFGIVYKAELMRPGEQKEIVAVKTLKGAYTDAEIDEILEEALKLKSFVHQNVLNLIGVSFQGCDTPYIVMPFMMNGSLLSYLRKDKKNLVLPKESDEDTVEDVSKRLTAMCQQIACGMEYLAGKKFVHRDLAARNCMIDSHGVIKIADFGLSEEVYSKTYFRQDSHQAVKLPIKWMAVESLHEGIFSEKTDVWAYGITCWEVFSGGKTPYPGISPPGVMQMLENGERLAIPNNAACTSNMYDIMKKCWMDDPNDRPTFSTIKSSLDQGLEEMADYLSLSLEKVSPLELFSSAEPESESMIFQNLNSTDTD